MRHLSTLIALTVLSIVLLALFVGPMVLPAHPPAASGPTIEQLPVSVYSVQPAGDPDADAAQAFAQTLVPLLAGYDGSAAWHRRFSPYVQIPYWRSYQADRVDQTIAFTRGFTVRSVEIDRYIGDESLTYWACEITYETGADEMPVILDLELERVNGTFKVRAISRDMC